MGKDRECKATSVDRLLCKKARAGAIKEGWEAIKEINGGPGGMLLRFVGDGAPLIQTKPGTPGLVKPPEMGAVDVEVAAISPEQQDERDKKAQALMRSLSLEAGDEFETELRSRLEAGEHAIDTDAAIENLRDAGLRTLRPGRYSAAAGLAGLQPDGSYTGPVVGLIPATAFINGEWIVTGFQVWRSPDVQAKLGGGKYQQLSRGRGVEDANYLSVRLDQETTDAGLLYVSDPNNAAEKQEPEILLLTDSSLKPYIASARLGHASVGSPGMQYSRVGGQLRQLLTRVCGSGPDRMPAVLCPDAGDIQQPQILSQLLLTQMQIQGWGWDVMWGWWGQTSKEGGKDVDEIDRNQLTQITTRELLNKTEELVRVMATRSAAQQGMLGFRPKKPNDVIETPFEVVEPEVYQEGDFDHVFQKKLEAGFRIVVNRAFTGAGKSAMTSKMKPARYGVRYIRWLTNRHMPQAQEFGVKFLSGKNYGLKTKANGELAVLQYGDEPGEGEKIVRGPNCHRIQDLVDFTDKKMDLSVSSICGTCSYKAMCEASKGGYRFERAESLKAGVVAVHPSSFMSMFVTAKEQDGVKSADTGVVIDEFNVGNFLDTHNTTLHHLQILMDRLHETGRSPRMQGMLRYLIGLLESEDAVFTDAQLRKESMLWLGPLIQMGRSEWESLQLWEENEARNGELTACLVAFFRDWVSNEAVMCIDKATLSVVRRNNRLLKAVASCAWVLIHDATVALREVAALIARPDEEIAVIAQEVPTDGAEVDVWQLTGAGALGFRRHSDAQFRANLVLDQIKKQGHIPDEGSAIIDTKASLEFTGGYAEHDMAWLVDNRGSNRAADATVLANVGTPVSNLRALADRYTLLFGEAPDLRLQCRVIHGVLQEEGEQEMVCVVPGCADADFRRYVHHTTHAEITQARGRLREYRRGGEMLRLIVIADYPQPFAVNLTDLAELPGWTKAKALTQAFVVHTIRTIQESGGTADRDSVATKLGVTRQTFDMWMETRQHEELIEINGSAGHETSGNVRPAPRRARQGALRCRGAKPVAA
ncbi:hypothetical protein N9C85_01595 [Synechococcus sp. AH-224-I15]|nr:hypothetical protein [Synechococcus sp. AH-224-I15]